ncbi:hypothetical protein [Pleomorphomonas sp. PLEO]|uniref:hypothetical protein n=1 Tax=Pleomorphomonas sp. PLEO TaxID=3239306 RepID=UPI00351F630E
MKSFAAALAFACFSAAALPAFAGDPTPVPSDKFPGWLTMTRETGTVFFYCRAPKICGEGSIVSFHFHDAPAPTKAEIREQQKEPRLPITCKNAGKYDTCEYPNAIDKKGRPTHWRPMPIPGLTADFFHSGHLSMHMPASSRTHFLITLASSATSYQQAKKNYAMFEAYLGKAIVMADLSRRSSL